MPQKFHLYLISNSFYAPLLGLFRKTTRERTDKISQGHSITHLFTLKHDKKFSLGTLLRIFLRTFLYLSTGSLFSEQRVREEHRRIAQKLQSLGSSSTSLCDYRIRQYNNNNNNNTNNNQSSGSPVVPPKPYVSRTYIGGAASSSLAMKIHRKNLQTRTDPPLSSLHHSCGSLSSLHETR